jgi:hypothetical protein
MDEASNERIVRIENLLSALTENMVAAEAAAMRRQAEWEKRQTEWDKRQDRLDRRVDRFARAGLAEVMRNRKKHAANDEVLDRVKLNLLEITDKLNALIRIEQDRQPPQG